MSCFDSACPVGFICAVSVTFHDATPLAQQTLFSPATLRHDSAQGCSLNTLGNGYISSVPVKDNHFSFALQVLSMAGGILSVISTSLGHLIATRYLTFAGYIVLLYDYALTFGDEVELVWSRPGNVVSIIFFINRYLTPVVFSIDIYDKGGLARDLTVKWCRTWFVVEGYCHFLLLTLVHALMLMRVNALWGNTRRIRTFLIVAYMIYLVVTLAILSPALIQTAATVYPENDIIHTCWGQITNYIWSVWIPALVLESIVFTLTAIRAWQYSSMNMSVPLMSTLYRDGFQYFLVIVLCSLFPLLIWVQAPMSLAALPKYATMGIVSTMASRIILNTRAYRLKPDSVTHFSEYELPSRKDTEIPATWRSEGTTVV